MIVSMIAALARNGVIGRDNGLPWRLPSDLKRFKSITMGKPIVMGRRTHESIGRPLPGRHNIVVTRNPGYLSEGCTVVHSVDEALETAAGSEEVVIIGGAELYGQLLPRADRLYLTFIDQEFSGDTYFPKFDMSQWDEVLNEPVEPAENVPLSYRFVILERRTR
jgi:dihydrofolate reductase